MGRKYSYDLKKQVVEKYFEGYSVPDLVQEFDIKNRRRVYEWIHKVKQGGYEALYDGRRLKTKKNHQITEIERLKLENEYLKKLLELQRG
jgi:transposase-like protein